MSIAKLAEMVGKTDNKTTMTMTVTSRGGINVRIDRQVNGKQKQLVHVGSNLQMQDADTMAQWALENLAEQALGVPDDEAA